MQDGVVCLDKTLPNNDQNWGAYQAGQGDTGPHEVG